MSQKRRHSLKRVFVKEAKTLGGRRRVIKLISHVFETELGCSSQGRVDATGLSRDLTSYWMVVRPSGHLVGALHSPN